MSSTTLLRSLAAVAAAVLVVSGCGDDDASPTTTSAGDTTTTESTTTTLPDESPTVAELWTNPVDDSGPDVDARVYMSIQGGATDDALVGVTVESDLAAGARLTPESRVELPATTTVDLDEDTTWIELQGLAAPLEYNSGFFVTLQFESSPDQRVEGAVRNPTDPEASN